ncbi:MAG: T9SS type A sorting domain-containing protein, partial [Flavobacteriales bacterium]|nr:T9SS type A sorting domain-containing protein [Flavobacteriales bacterium]
WDFGDGQTSTDPNPQHSYSTVSTFEVMYIASSACTSDTTYLSVNVTSLLSIPDQQGLGQIRLTQDANGVSISNKGESNIRLELLDISGRVLATYLVAAKCNHTISSSLKSGIYLIRASTDKASRTFRFVNR